MPSHPARAFFTFLSFRRILSGIYSVHFRRILSAISSFLSLCTSLSAPRDSAEFLFLSLQGNLIARFCLGLGHRRFSPRLSALCVRTLRPRVRRLRSFPAMPTWRRALFIVIGYYPIFFVEKSPFTCVFQKFFVPLHRNFKLLSL